VVEPTVVTKVEPPEVTVERIGAVVTAVGAPEAPVAAPAPAPTAL
jgi:hypothetical protein